MSKTMTLEEMYNELINNSDYNNAIYPTAYNDDDDDDFMTSKEIVKSKNEINKKFGISTDSIGDGVIEEEIHFKRYTKRREYKYTEKEMEDIRRSCERTIVHDYGENDRYHWTNEERASNDMLSELSMKLSSLKRTYNKVDQYIYAMRVVLQAWEMLEEKGNFMHTKDEFFKMVAEGRIVSNQIVMPRLKKMDKYNIELIIEYISNPELDPSDLVPEPIKSDYDDWYDEEEEDIEAKMTRLLSPEEFEYINSHQDNLPEMEVASIKKKYLKGYNRRSYNVMGKKNKKKGNKTDRYIQEGLHELLHKIQVSQRPTYGYTATSSIIDDMFDVGKKKKSFWDDLYFTGSWASKKDNELLDLIINEEMMKETIPGSGYVTYGDKELSDFFKILEENGVNTVDLRRKMNCSPESISKSTAKKEKKKNKEMEARIVQRITKLNHSDKFKKLVSKAEASLNKQYEEY